MLNKTTFLISIILVSVANNTTWYITSTGDDNNNGTSENDAFATIVQYQSRAIVSRQGAPPTIINSILWNEDIDIEFYIDESSTINVEYSNIRDGWEGEGNIFLDPLFVDEAEGDFNILQYSPCINTGHTDSDGDGITWENDPDDQDPDGTRMDMGAFYYNQEGSVTVTFLANTCGVPDILHENSTVQIRGSLPAFGIWNSSSPAYMTNIGGDYWEYSITLSPGDISVPIEYKYNTSRLPQDQLPDVWHGWEGGANWKLDLSNFTGTDTVLELGYVRGWANVSPGSIPFNPTDSIDVFFRVNMQAKIEDGSFDPDSQIVSVRGSNTVDWGQTGDLSWTKSVPFIRENVHVNGEVGAEYDGTNFWSCRIRIPNQWVGQELQYKFVYHDKDENQIQFEEPLSTGGLNRSIILPLEGETTVHWVWWNDEPPYETSQLNVWHVSSTGSDETGNGSEGNPFATIQHGIDMASDEDEILVNDGLYTESIWINKPLVLRSLNGPSNIKITNNDGSMAIMTIEYGIDSVEIIGFTFRDGHRSGQNGSALDIFADSKVTIDNCIFINNYAESLPDAWGGTIVVGGGTQTNVLIKNTLIKQNTADNGGGAGIRIGGNDIPVTMRRVLIVNNQGTAIHVDNGSLRVLNGTIVGNIGGILLNEYSNGEIINTILMENFPEPAISLENGSSASVTYSNVEGGYTGIGNMNANPLFVDEENGDYHLLIDSPCIDTGHPDLDGDGITWENDLDDQDPDGTRMDMGAFFYPHFLTNTAISSNPDTLSILDPIDTIVITFSVPFDPTTVVSNIEVNSSRYGSFPFEISLSTDDRNIYINPILTYPLTDTIYVTLKQGITDLNGFLFDYDSDDILSDYDLKFITPLLGDYNSDFSVNFDDFITFRDTWWGQDQMDVTPFELHPYFGTPPFVILQPDSNFAYDDLMTFIWMWNWSHVQSSNTTFTLGQKVASTDSRIKFTHYYSNYDPWRQNLSIPIELELTIDNPETVSSVEIILSYNQNELVFNDIKYASSVDCNDCDWINLEYNTEKSSQLIINMVAFNKDRLLQPGANLLNSINFKAHVQDSTTIRYYYDIRYYGEKSVNQDVGSGKYTLKIVNPRPEGFTLLPNFPNPFNPVTTIKYNLPEQTMVRLTIFDILGRQVRTLVNQQQEPGFKSIQWNARDDFGRSVGAGVYIYRIEAGDFHKTNKMILMK